MKTLLRLLLGGLIGAYAASEPGPIRRRLIRYRIIILGAVLGSAIGVIAYLEVSR